MALDPHPASDQYGWTRLSGGAHFVVDIEDTTQIAEARRRATELAVTSRFDEQRIGNVALAVTEVGSNILKHAARGRILLTAVDVGDHTDLEILAVDQGPGMADVSHSMRDGHSTSGTLGGGLGALRRASDEFGVYSQVDKGTVVRLVFRAPTSGAALPAFAALCLAKAGEEIAGDEWGALVQGTSTSVLVADGLGHGPDAAAASAAAAEEFRRRPDLAPAALLSSMKGPLASTRGAAVGVARVDASRATGLFAGVGNISAVVVDEGGAAHHLVSHNGIVGHNMPRVREYAFSFPRNALLILHSDGLGTQWDLASHPGLVSRHPALIAGVLWRDFDRGRDDVTIVALRSTGE